MATRISDLSKQVKTLVSHESRTFQVENLQRYDIGDVFWSNRFFVTLKCCQEQIKWLVIFNENNLSQAPDILFSPQDESFQPLTSFEEGTNSENDSLRAIFENWKIDEDGQLLLLMFELRKRYFDHQKQLLEGISDQRVKFELSSVAHILGLEAFVVGGAENPSEVQISVPVPGIDYSNVHSLLASDQSQQAMNGGSICLQVKYPLNGYGNPQVKIECPEALNWVFQLAEIRTPPWTDDMCLVEYMPMLKQVLQQQVSEAAAAFDLRSKFVSCLPLYFGRPLEADTKMFRRASLFLSCNSSLVLIHMSIPSSFPKAQPTLTIQSCQSFDSSLVPLISKGYSEYPWSPRWEVEEMMIRIRKFLQEQIKDLVRA